MDEITQITPELATVIYYESVVFRGVATAEGLWDEDLCYMFQQRIIDKEFEQ